MEVIFQIYGMQDNCAEDGPVFNLVFLHLLLVFFFLHMVPVKGDLLNVNYHLRQTIFQKFKRSQRVEQAEKCLR